MQLRWGLCRSGLTRTDVCNPAAHGIFSLTEFATFVAKPTIHVFAQSTGLYVGGDQAAFFMRYPAPVTSIVSRPSSCGDVLV